MFIRSLIYDYQQFVQCPVSPTVNKLAGRNGSYAHKPGVARLNLNVSFPASCILLVIPTQRRPRMVIRQHRNNDTGRTNATH